MIPEEGLVSSSDVLNGGDFLYFVNESIRGFLLVIKRTNPEYVVYVLKRGSAGTSRVWDQIAPI